MFGKKKSDELQTDHVDTIIGAESSFNGALSATGTIRVDGKFEGEINCTGDLIVGDNGKIKANIKVRNLILSGQLEGNVSVQGKIEITHTGKLFGDISTGKLIIDEGAVFKGKCDMQHGSSTISQNGNSSPQPNQSHPSHNKNKGNQAKSEG